MQEKKFYLKPCIPTLGIWGTFMRGGQELNMMAQ